MPSTPLLSQSLEKGRYADSVIFSETLTGFCLDFAIQIDLVHLCLLAETYSEKGASSVTEDGPGPMESTPTSLLVSTAAYSVSQLRRYRYE